jgi:hypothetical protein
VPGLAEDLALDQEPGATPPWIAAFDLDADTISA